jgi:hypothetical protein
MLLRCRPIFCLLVATLSLTASATTLTLVSTTPTSFPTTAIGATSAAQTVQFTLGGALTIKSIAVPPSINTKQEFVVGAITGCTLGVSTASGTTCSVSITFSPAYPGTRQQPLVITDSTGQTYSFGLTGTATGSLSVRYPGVASTNIGSVSGFSGDGAAATSAGLGYPYGMALDNSNNEYFSDYNTGNVRVVYEGTGTDNLACLIEVAEPTLFGLATGVTSCAGATSQPVAGDIYTLAGSKVAGHAIANGFAGDGGMVSLATVYQPASIAVDAAGSIFFGDSGNFSIRVIYAGGPQAACLIELENPMSFGLAAGATSCAGATSQPGFGTIWKIAGKYGSDTVLTNNESASLTQTVYPYALALSPNDDLFFTDDSSGTSYNNARLRVIYNGGTNASCLIQLENTTLFPGATISNCAAAATQPTPGYVYAIAGSTGSGNIYANDSGDGGLASSAGILYARGLALDPNGNLFFSEYNAYAALPANNANKVRAVYLQGTAVAAMLSRLNNGVTPTPGYIYDVAGINSASAQAVTAGYSGDGGLASAAQLSLPIAVALDPAGNIYIGDINNFRIRKVNIADGIITTAFGNGTRSGSNSNEVYGPYSMAVGSDGTLFFSEYTDYKLREVSIGAYPLTTASSAAPQTTGQTTSTVTATTYTATGTAATIVAPNTLSVGQSVTLAGFTTTEGLLFNGNTYTVTAATTTQFTFNFSGAATSAAVTDAGNATYTDLPQQFIEANIGNSSLTVNSVSEPLNWTAGAGTVAGVNTCSTTNQTLASGTQCSISTQFFPLIAGAPLTGSLYVYDTALNTSSTPHLITLYGYSVGTAGAILQLTTSRFTATPTQPITLTATITGAAGTPTGTITFTDTTLNTVVCNTVPLSAPNQTNFSATATCGPLTYALGTHVIKATYNGDPNFNPTTSSPVTLVIALLQPTLLVGVSSGSPNLGAAETFTATLSGTLTPPNGQVTFTYGTPATQIGTVQTLPGTTPDTATVTTTTLPAGQDCVTATYSGDSNYGTTSSTVCISVIPPAYTLSSTVTGIIVPRGFGTSVPLTITTVGGYSQAISGSCTNLPVGVSCVFQPTVYQASGVNGIYSTWSVFVQATGDSASLNQHRTYDLAFLLFPLSLAGLAGLRRRKALAAWQRSMLLLLVICGSGVGFTVLSGCAGTSNISPKETVNINIVTTDTANSATSTQSIPLTITIVGSSSH